MTWARLVVQTHVASAPSTGIDTTGADLLVVAITSPNSQAGGFTDSKGNTWNVITSDTGASITTDVFWCVPTSVGSAHTFDHQAGTGAMIIEAWSGAAASPFSASQTDISGSTTTFTTTALTPTEANCIIFAAHGPGDAGLAVSSPFNDSPTIMYGETAVSYGCALAHTIQTTAAAQAATWSWTAASGNANVLVAFKVAVPPGGAVGGLAGGKLAGRGILLGRLI